MSEFKVPTKEQAKTLRENGIDPDAVAVMADSEEELRLMCYRTRRVIWIMKGDTNGY